MADSEQAQIEAVIENTIFRNEENGYSVVEARMGRDKITVVGTLPALVAGEQVLLSGTWVEHPSYGRQWKADACEVRKPTTLLGIERCNGGERLLALFNFSEWPKPAQLEGGGSLADAVRAFLASAADEYPLDLFRVLDLVREVYSSAHQPVVREHLRTGKGDVVRLHTTH